MKILITGSSGYIGSCCYEFLKKKHIVFGLDKNENILKKQKNFFKTNISKYQNLKKIIKIINPEAIIHLAGQSTIEGIQKKKNYVINNQKVTENVVKTCNQFKIKHIIFASTAAVYHPQKKNLSENSLLKPTNIYGITKRNCEKIILKKLKKPSNAIIFRFFNVCSSLYKKHKIGEFHSPETHLIPIAVSKFLKKKKINIYGNNFNTKDGTCIRDYIHIKDLLKAFELGLKYLKKNNSTILNLGSNKGYSVLDICNIIKKILKIKKNNLIKIVKNRRGDVAKLVCASKKAEKYLNWRPTNSKINKIVFDEIKWHKFLKKKKFIRKYIY